MAPSVPEELDVLENRWRALFDQAPVGMAEVRLDSIVVSANAALQAELGRRQDEIVGVAFTDFVHADQRESLASLLSMNPGVVSHDVLELRLEHANGANNRVEVHVATLPDQRGVEPHLLITCVDVTTQRHYEAEVQQLIDHDPATGLLSRTGFESVLRKALAEGSADPLSALVLLDIDHLKAINERQGYLVGDETIAAVGATLRQRLRASDAIARVSDDRFAVLLANTQGDQAESVATDLVRDVRNQVAFRDGDRLRQVTVSAGVVMIEGRHQSASELLANGDIAVKVSRAAGGNRTSWGPSDQEGGPGRGQLGSSAPQPTHSLDEDHFVLLTQPILDLQSSTIDRYELLLRIRNEDGTLGAPGELLGFAERAGRVGRIDRWVVNRAIEIVKSHRDRPDLKFEINISGRSIGDPHLMAFIEQRVRNSGIDPKRLIFEISEVSAVANIDFAREFSRQLARIGCQFALDNFGSDLGGFYILKHVPFDYLKIDGEFVVGCLEDPTDQLLIDAIVHIAQGLGKRTIAQFVPDGPTLDYLKLHGVDYAQGYYIGEPSPTLSGPR